MLMITADRVVAVGQMTIAGEITAAPVIVMMCPAVRPQAEDCVTDGFGQTNGVRDRTVRE